MSREWTQEEIQVVSKAMEAAGDELRRILCRDRAADNRAGEKTPGFDIKK